MSGLLIEHLETVKKSSKGMRRELLIIGAAFFSIWTVLYISMYMLGLLRPFSLLTYSEKNTALAYLALFVSLFALGLTSIDTRLVSDKEFHHYFKENNIKQKEEHLKHIQERINLFYLPLSVLLTIPDKPEYAQARAQKIAEINCNKHLAEPRMRAVFERYMEGKKDPKMLELACRDIENLQKEYAMEKKILTEESESYKTKK